MSAPCLDVHFGQSCDIEIHTMVDVSFLLICLHDQRKMICESPKKVATLPLVESLPPGGGVCALLVLSSCDNNHSLVCS